jgi:recombination protein RecR
MQPPSETTDPLSRLMESFQKLPGVGPKTAQRLAFYVLKQPEVFASSFAQALITAKESVKPCPICFHLSSQAPCEICQSKHRLQQQVCVVADPRDVFALERTQEYRGLYHVLGGVISPLDGIGPEQLNIKSLLERTLTLDEIILALPPTTEGDTTSLYLAKLLAPLKITVSRIAFGLPVGGDLDYADSLTITRALQGRQLVS